MKFARRRDRTAVAGIVATVIMFAILFTVGTSYFIFVSSQNSSYVSNLLAATNKAQGSLEESLTVNTVLESNGDVGFNVNDTSAVTINMTAALVISSTGALLKCDGVGFPAGAGCSNTTPTLWMVVNAGGSSQSLDTGYVYVTGTTDTVKVLTARGNTYSATYPAPADQSSSSQAVTVSLDNLKWVQLIPEASSLVQQKYVANCNAASCALAYNSHVTASNILVDAVSWPSNSPPSGVPTDTLNDLFTLGASSSVNVATSAAVVQNKYTSNCNAASCGLAFNTNVVSGHTLVFGLGWANQSPPSAPTDTRGDTFTLGASQSVTVTPPTASVVQRNYLSNCNSATCSLAYTSSVTAGNTLVYGLGWGGYPYIPITITNNQGTATANPLQEMVTWDPATYTSYEATNLGNIRFCTTSACTTQYNSWLESCSSTCSSAGSTSTSATAWVKLTSAIAGSGGTLTIYMVFKQTYTNFDGVYWGEAPELSTTYAQYDNGANVFTNYWNFAGTTCPTGWTCSGMTISNGITATEPSYAYTTATYGLTANIMDFYGNLAQATTTQNAQIGYVHNTPNGPVVAWDINSNNGGNGCNSANACIQTGTSVSTYAYTTAQTTGTQVYSIYWGSSASVTGWYGYSNSFTSTTDVPNAAISIGIYNAQGAQATIGAFNWLRLRVYPPSGVMPTSAFGSLNNAAAPTVSDTLGDAFTLGASQSVAGSGTNPSIVQHNYQANCNSATCALAYSSSVTAGNTLVYGLGWFGGNSYVPVTITNNVAGLALDGSTTAGSGGSATNTQTTGTLTTTQSNDLIVVIASLSDGSGGSTSSNTVSTVTATGLTFTHRVSAVDYSNPNYYADVEEWYAVASSTFSNTITVTTTASDRFTVIAYGISGANTASPFDANAGAHPTASGISNSPSVTQSTSNANDMLITGLAVSQTPGTINTFPTGYTNVANPSTGGFGSQAEGSSDYNIVSATQSSSAVSYSLSSSSNSWAMLADAIQGLSTATPNPFQQMITWDPATYSSYEATNLGNVRFCTTSACTTQLDGWLESCSSTCSSAGSSSTSATAWVKLTSAIQGNGGTLTIYMVFEPTNTNFDDNYWGEAPQLSGTYAQYDNGANVFTAYFNGNTATGGFSVSGGGTYAVAQATGVGGPGGTTINAIHFTGHGSANPDVAFVYTTALGNTGLITEAAVENANDATNSGFVGFADNAAAGSVQNAIDTGDGAGTDYFQQGYDNAGTVTVGANGAGAGVTTWVYASVTYSGTSATSFYSYIAPQLYSTTGGYSATENQAPITGATHLYFGTLAASSGGFNLSLYYDWGRVRAYPPSNTMPSVSFGSTSSTSGAPTSVTDTLGSAYTLAASNSVTSGGTTYYSYIWYATAPSSGADTVTATFSSTVTGSESVYEINGAIPSVSSTGSSSSSQASSSVTSMTPSSVNSVVIGNTETSSTSFTAGAGYTDVNACASVYGCSEYQTGVGAATTVPMSLSPSAPWVEAAIGLAPNAPNYYSYIWYATASSSGANTVTATFSGVVAGSESVYEITGYSTSSVPSSTGSSSGGSTAASVTSFTPASNSFVVGNVESGSSSTTYTVGSGFTLSGTCTTVQGCGEYETGLGTATTVPITLSASATWVESAISFAPASAVTYYSYIWYATAGSSGADTISASFGATTAGSVSIYELSGLTTTGLLSSTGSSTSSQGATSVTSMTPNTGSIVIGNTETTSTTYTAGSGYTLSGSCGTVSGCGEYQTGVGSATTVPMSLSPSAPWVEAALAFAPVTTNYYSYIWYATASSSGADTITTTFGSTVAASVSIYEITGFTTSGALTSTGSSSTGSTTAAVTSFTPSSDSFTVGTAESASSTTFTATSGFTLDQTGANCTTVGGCSEYNAGGGGSATTVPITLGASHAWVEAAMSFSTPFDPQSGIQVGGYPTMGVPSGASLVWEVTFTNVDPLHRAITIWPQTEMAIGSAEYDGFDTDYTQAHYYLISSLNPGSTTVNPYSTTAFITLAYNVPTTLYFAATQALGSTTQAFGTNVLTPFEAYFALTGMFSDGSLYGETIPYPYGIITQASAYTTPTSGLPSSTVTVSCTTPCHFDAGASAIVGWINSGGQLTQLTTFTVSGSGNIPAGVTFTVPATATAGYYTIEVTDYINSVFMTYQVT